MLRGGDTPGQPTFPAGLSLWFIVGPFRSEQSAERQPANRVPQCGTPTALNTWRRRAAICSPIPITAHSPREAPHPTAGKMAARPEGGGACTGRGAGRGRKRRGGQTGGSMADAGESGDAVPRYRNGFHPDTWEQVRRGAGRA